MLAIDCATLCGGAAIVDHRGVLAEHVLRSRSSHSVRILATVDALLQETGLKLRDLGGIAVTRGPGSFTGVRVGISTAKGLAFADGLPLIGISSLEALAWRCSPGDRLICPVIDARRHEIFAAGFRQSGDTHPELKIIISEQVNSIGAFLQNIEAPAVFLGDGAQKYRQTIEERLGSRAAFAHLDKMLPSPSAVAGLGLQKFMRGEADSPAGVVPVYLRDADAKKVAATIL